MQRKKFTLAELAEYTNARLIGDPNHTITDVSDLESATPHDASFLSNPRYAQAMLKSKAGVIFISPNASIDAQRNFLVHENPSQAFQKIVEAFHGNCNEFSGFTGIHPTAVIHPTTHLENVTVGPYAVIDKNVKIGNGTFIGSHCYIGPNTAVGQNCTLHPHVIVRERCVIGDNVILQPGAVVGSCGFGYLTDKQGKHTKLNQVGSVIIDNDVEIGANTTIDRARFKATRIGRGSKLDNLVQIAHGVVVGEDNIFAAQTGIAGSTATGRCVIAGGQVAIAGHLKIADGVILAGRSGVSKSLTERGEYSGVPVSTRQEYNRNSVYLRNLETYVKQIKDLEQRLSALENR